MQILNKWVWVGAREATLWLHSLVMLMLLVHGPHFE